MIVQDFLRSFPTPRVALEAIRQPPHGVVVVTDGRRALLNYGLDTPKGGMYGECRALMLALPSFDVLSMSFKRFYNAHEGQAAKIDWATAAVEEKVDGSLIVFYRDGEHWTFHTRGTLDAEGGFSDAPGTFRACVLALIERETGGSPDGLFADENEDHCFICEYVGPYNRIVTRYDCEDLYLLALMDRRRQVELLGAEHAVEWPFSRPCRYDLPRTLEALQASFSTLPPLSEGYVVRDGACNRIKVKDPSYLAIFHAVNAGSGEKEKHFARLALLGDTAEIKGYFPEFAARIAGYELRVERMAAGAEALWTLHHDAPSQKDFAAAVKDTPLSPWLFLRRAGKTTLGARAWMRETYRPERLTGKEN